MKYVLYAAVFLLVLSASFMAGVALDGYAAKRYSDRFVEISHDYVQIMEKIECTSLYSYWLDNKDDKILGSFVLENCVMTI